MKVDQANILLPILITLTLTGCLEATAPANDAQHLIEGPTIVQEANETPLAPPENASSMAPAAIGEWINGTLVDIRLASVDVQPPGDNPDAVFANYTFEFRWHTNDSIVVRGERSFQTQGPDLSDKEEMWTTTQRARTQPFRIEVYYQVGEPGTIGSGLRYVDDWNIYWFDPSPP